MIHVTVSAEDGTKLYALAVMPHTTGLLQLPTCPRVAAIEIHNGYGASSKWPDDAIAAVRERDEQLEAIRKAGGWIDSGDEWLDDAD